jgi:hypothetical protein
MAPLRWIVLKALAMLEVVVMMVMVVHNGDCLAVRMLSNSVAPPAAVHPGTG